MPETEMPAGGSRNHPIRYGPHNACVERPAWGRMSSACSGGPTAFWMTVRLRDLDVPALELLPEVA